MIINEINNLKSMDHPNIQKIYEHFESEKHYYIITDLCEGGELFDEIVARGNFTEKDASIIMKNLLSGVNFCH
jgi:calcium-dependent protein kinase